MITIRNLTKKYKSKSKNKLIFDHMSLDIDDPSKIYSLVGESGSGKTTLFNILFGLDKDYSGSYRLFGKEASNLNNAEWTILREKYIRLVFQDYKLLDNFTVYENLKLTGNYPDEKIDTILNDLDILVVKQNTVSELSGGQKQRVAIARAIIAEPKIVLLDEPTGNLDGMTSEKIMDYLDKLRNKGILIFIITHDVALSKLADVVFELQDKKITKIAETSSSVNIPRPIEINRFSEKKPIGNYVLNSLTKTKKKIIYLAIPTILILTFFILGFSAYRANSTLSFKKLFDGIGERIILLDTQRVNQKEVKSLNERGIQSSFDGNRIAFSEEDVKKTENIKNVKEVYLSAGDIISNYDKDHNTLNSSYQSTSFSDQLKKYMNLGNKIDTLSFNFVKSHVPKELISDYNKDNLELLSGEFPTDKTNEIIVPDVYVLLEKNNDDFDGIIGKKIVLSIKDKDNQEKKNEYIVSGVYNTNYKNALNITYPIYTSFFQEDLLSSYLTEESYNFYKNQLTVNEATKNFNRNIIQDYESYKEAVGTGNPMMIVKVNKGRNLSEASKKLEAMYPYYHLISQYDLKNGELGSIYSYLVRILLIGSVLIALITGILIAFLNKGYINNRSKELAILYSLGFKKTEIFSIIALENTILFSIYSVIACILVYISNRIYFSKTAMFQLFATIFEPFNIMVIFLLILLMLAVSIIWGLNGVKQSNLRKYLNE